MARKVQLPHRDPLADFFRPQAPQGVAELTEAKRIDRERIDPNPFQPRRSTDTRALDELAASIREHGVLQPLLVRPLGDRYQIVAGERRWRAAGLAGLSQLPCTVREVSDGDLEVLTLLENIQRADLAPVDEAYAYRRLLDRIGMSQRALAGRLHKDHEYIAQRLRLIADPQIEEGVRAGMLGPTVGQELARVDDPARRQDLLGRAARGERVTVQEVKQARARRPVAHHPASVMPAAEVAPVQSGPPAPEAHAPNGGLPGPGEQARRQPSPQQAATHGGPQPSVRALLAACSPSVQGQIAQVLRYGVDAGWSCEELWRHLGL